MPHAHAIARLLALAATAGALACAREPPSADAQPLPHEAYVWQRAWTPSVVDAVRRRGASFAGLRVLAAEIERDAVVAVHPDAAALAGQHVTLVVRVDGSVPPDAARLVSAVDDARARFSDVDVRAVEIDHDCATVRLPAYAASLTALAQHLQGAGVGADRVSLSITALPAWSNARALDHVVAAVDHVVLQVHAVDAPTLGDARVDGHAARRALFAADRARASIDAFAARAARTGVAWRVALPAYGHALIVDDHARVVRVDSEPLFERGRAPPGERLVDVRADPREVQALLRSLDDARPAGLAGVVWFRLPVDGDRRAWPFATLAAVRDGAPLEPRVRVDVRRVDAALHDVIVANDGLVEAAAPARIDVDVAGLIAADGTQGFAFSPAAERAGATHHASFSSAHPPRVAPGGALVVGWVRAQEVRPHVAPAAPHARAR